MPAAPNVEVIRRLESRGAHPMCSAFRANAAAIGDHGGELPYGQDHIGAIAEDSRARVLIFHDEAARGQEVSSGSSTVTQIVIEHFWTPWASHGMVRASSGGGPERESACKGSGLARTAECFSHGTAVIDPASRSTRGIGIELAPLVSTFGQVEGYRDKLAA